MCRTQSVSAGTSLVSISTLLLLNIHLWNHSTEPTLIRTWILFSTFSHIIQMITISSCSTDIFLSILFHFIFFPFGTSDGTLFILNIVQNCTYAFRCIKKWHIPINIRWSSFILLALFIQIILLEVILECLIVVAECELFQNVIKKIRSKWE